ncbi:MAG: phytoene/squalene synthase family protein [Fimbriiglobus sp.]|jgi:phytoene synthase|nr:phytoene/squalene synthase family protein [Fimbriiglobus sp.]
MTDREVIRRQSKSFALAARLLPRAQREQAEALYAWCRAADDRIDLAGDSMAAASALAELRAEVEDVYAGRPVATPAADALRRVVAACNLPREYPLDMLAGFKMDVRGTQYQTETELLMYCHRVAGVVGLMMCHALGVTDDAALPHAAHLGIAMQLTNVARDVAEDWGRGRLYLPAEWLDRVPRPGEPLDDVLLAPAVRRCLELADRYYQSGEVGLKYLQPRCRLAIATAARVYRAIGTRVSARGCRPSAGRAIVSTRAKIVILARTSFRLLPALVRGRGPVRPPRGVGTFAPIPKTETLSLPCPEVRREHCDSVLA